MPEQKEVTEYEAPKYGCEKWCIEVFDKKLDLFGNKPADVAGPLLKQGIGVAVDVEKNQYSNQRNDDDACFAEIIAKAFTIEAHHQDLLQKCPLRMEKIHDSLQQSCNKRVETRPYPIAGQDEKQHEVHHITECAAYENRGNSGGNETCKKQALHRAVKRQLFCKSQPGYQECFENKEVEPHGFHIKQQTHQHGADEDR